MPAHAQTTRPTEQARRDLGSERLRALGATLERVASECDVTARLRLDPVGVVRRYESDRDREIAGLVAACLAFGNIVALRRSVERVLERLGPRPARALDDAVRAHARLRGVGHRMVRDVDIARLLVGARGMQREHGSLGARFAELLEAEPGALRPALVAWVAELRLRSGLGHGSDGARRGPAHVLPSPSGSSACKRLLLYLRWMVRPDDGVDLGLWRNVSPSVLLVPLDTHVHRLARSLGLTRRATASWLAAEEVTAALRLVDPADPVRFDFALCHLGMTSGCEGRRGAGRCGACVLRPACRLGGRAGRVDGRAGVPGA
jgi:uncharacterized protein (TIGR02757 family)